MGEALVKARAEDLPGYPQRKAIEDKHRSAIRRALEAVSGVSRAVSQAHAQGADSPEHAQAIAQHAVTQNMSADSRPLAQAIGSAMQDAVQAGADRAAADGVAISTTGSRSTGILGSVDSGAQQIMQNSMTRAAAKIAEGLLIGKAVEDITSDVMDAIASDSRADMIAVTQVNIAENLSYLDQIGMAGYPQWEWLAYEGACDYCEEASGLHALDDLSAWNDRHPNCRCAIVLPENANDTIPTEE